MNRFNAFFIAEKMETEVSTCFNCKINDFTGRCQSIAGYLLLIYG